MFMKTTGWDIRRDQLRRDLFAMRGFMLCPGAWLFPWLIFTLWPLGRRLGLVPSLRVIDLGPFRVRLNESDLSTFANLFEDYRLAPLKRALTQVELVIDAGANVGAFCWLTRTVAERIKRWPLPLIAIEPEEENFRFLQTQPFRPGIECIQGALGPEEGGGHLVAGVNAVTHKVDFMMGAYSLSEEKMLPVRSLSTLCAGRRTLLKMDIEGGELPILEKGLPEAVCFMFLEWHGGSDQGADPRPLIPRGRWELLSRDLEGSSCWFWESGGTEQQID